MKDWRATLTPMSATLGEAIGQLDKAGMQIVMMVDDQARLLGILTDGDIRRGLMRGMTLNDPVAPIVNTKPATATPGMSRAQRLDVMRRRGIRQLPMVDPQGAVVGLDTLEDALLSASRNSAAVIMAGGLGQRLRPLTDDMPKPMLEVGGRPLIETLVRNLVSQGFSRIFISVNYKAEVIEQHFGDGSEFGAEIHYLREQEKLGTAGALSLLPEKPEAPLLVLNGDILTNVNFGSMLDFHNEHKAAATMAVRDYHFQVPYGIVTTDDLFLTSIVEKPTYNWFVSAGIYVIAPHALKAMMPGKLIDMPAFLEQLRTNDNRVAVFPIREYWLDIGRLEDFERALNEFPVIFK